MDLPPIERLQAMEVRPTDVIVATCANPHMSMGDRQRVHDALKDRFPANKILVLPPDISLAVQGPEE